MFSISKYIQPQLNNTFVLFTLGSYDQYFGVQMQKYSEKGRKLPKNYTIYVIQRPMWRHRQNSIKIMFSISIQPRLNTTVFLFTLGTYEQYFGVQMQKISEKDVNCQKLQTCTIQRPRWRHRQNFIKACLAYQYSPWQGYAGR